MSLPNYQGADLKKQSYWRHRGKLDVPKERFMLPENLKRAIKRKTRFPPHPDPTPSAASDPIRQPYDNRRSPLRRSWERQSI